MVGFKEKSSCQCANTNDLTTLEQPKFTTWRPPGSCQLMEERSDNKPRGSGGTIAECPSDSSVPCTFEVNAFDKKSCFTNCGNAAHTKDIYSSLYREFTCREDDGLSTAAIVGIVIGAAVACAVLLAVLLALTRTLKKTG